MRALIAIATALALGTAAAAMTVEEFQSLDFLRVLEQGHSPNGTEYIVAGAAGPLDGEHRVGAGLFVARGERPELLAYFYLDADDHPQVCQPEEEVWRCEPVSGRNRELVRDDLLGLREGV